MRILTTAAVLALSSAGPAFAADLSAKPWGKAPHAVAASSGWTGFYVGGTVGGGFANAPSDFSVAGGPVFGTAPNSPRGVLGGVQAGYNWQNGSIVYGIETDFQFTGMSDKVQTPCPAGVCGVPIQASYGHDIDWFGTARGRIGYAGDNWMIYATGGYAYARLSTTAIATAGATEAIAKWNDTRGGWTMGGGIEVAINRQWSVKAEYLYADLGRFDQSWTVAPLPTILDQTRLDMNIVRVGVNYRF